MTIQVLDPANGSNTNDGLDFHGFGLVAATFTTATKTLSLTGAFTGYTFNSGDRIAITGGTGVTTGYYEIASKTSNDAIVLVADIGGTNPSDVTSSDGPWATSQYVFDNWSQGDTCYACATATETTATTIDIDTTSGGSSNQNHFRGRDGTNGSTAAQYTIASTAGMGAVALLDDAGFADDHLFSNITLDATASGTEAYDQSADTTTQIVWVSCKFIAGTVSNYNSRNSDHVFIDCDFEDATAHAIRAGSNRSLFKIVGCRINNPGDVGIRIRASKYGYVANTLIWGCGGNGIELDTGRLHWSFFNNTIDGSGGDGLDLASSSGDRMTIVGNVFSNNGGYGVNFADHSSNTMAYNHYYNNTSGPTSYVEVDTDDFLNPPGTSNTSGDPLYKDAAAGDFEPESGSALLLGAYSGQMNIGAIGNPLGSGSGGISKLAGDSGGLVG